MPTHAEATFSSLSPGTFLNYKRLAEDLGIAFTGVRWLANSAGPAVSVLLSFMAGCGGLYMRAAATDRAVIDLSCPSDKIEVEDVGGGAYRATGCNRTATYVCSTGDHVTTTCVREGAGEPASPVAPKSGGEVAKGGEPARKNGCEPLCSPGYQCSGTTCMPLCNPECAGTDVCRKDRTCGPPPANSSETSRTGQGLTCGVQPDSRL